MRVKRTWLFIGAIVLLLPALLINLGLHTFIDDEAIRSLVALEMKLSGNYITPTLHGEYYYNKPPLYNWILLIFFNLAGTFNEFVARIPTVLALLGYGATIYYFFRKHYDRKTAFLNAFVFITCGRVLFWDSMLALIDTTFSWVTFTAFMIVFHEFEKKRWYRLFLFSYLLTAAGFLMKGLPSVVFQGITLVAYFAYRREFRRLFSLPHIVGGLSFLLVVGTYYAVYHQYNSLENVFATLFTESSKRTVVNYGLGHTILHFFAFPFEMVYHFLPWSLMVIYFFRRGVLREILQDRFITFNLLVFLANILIYWLSPEVYPRYLLMLAPLLFSSFLFLHFKHHAERTWQFLFLDRLFGIVVAAISLLSFAPLFLARTQWHDLLILKTLVVALPLVGLAYAWFRLKEDRLVVMVLFLLVFRVGFDIFVLPDRNRNDFGDLCRETTKAAGRAFADQPLYLYKSIEMQATNSFYLTNERGSIVPRRMDHFDPDALYIIYPEATDYDIAPYEKVGEFKMRHGKLTFDIGRLK